ncbi:MAG: PAS domain S-box protein [Desulfobacteraceae bacterium]|nr:MAG: PAS domain S-box protein [Desulfobacteraceae bacterium]
MKQPADMPSPIQREAQLRLIMDHVVDVVVLVDSQGLIQFITPSAERNLGYNIKEQVGKSAFEFAHPEDRELSLASFQDTLQTGVGKKIEVRIRHQDGRFLWMELLGDPITGDDGRISGMVLVCRDISDRKKMEEEIGRLNDDLEKRVEERTEQLRVAKRDLEAQVEGHQSAEKALRESEKKYRELVNFLPISIFEVDMELNILSGNPTIYETFGYNEEDVKKGLNAFNLISPESHNRARSTILRLMRAEKTGGTQYTGVRKDGSTFPIVIFANPVMQGNKPVGLRGAIIDLSAQKQVESDLQKARDLLIQSEKLVSIARLSTGVAHEILNPMNIICMELQMLQGMQTLSPEAMEDLNICMDQVKRIVKIAEGLKQFARLPMKRFVVSDLNRIIENLLTLYSPQLRIQGIEVEVQCQPNLPQIPISREKIEQAVVNLIMNGVAAMEDSERKLLRVSTTKTVSTEGDDHLRIMIADTGGGIRKEDMTKIFDPFFTTKEYGKGTGLGLFISYGIIQDHGGKIWAENNRWGGATFFIDLPVDPERTIPIQKDGKLTAKEDKTGSSTLETTDGHG